MRAARFEHALMTSKSQKRVLTQFGLAVRLKRKARGFSQESFADYIGLDRSYMGGVERGQRNLAFENIMHILEGLDMQPAVFFHHLTIERRQDRDPMAEIKGSESK
jgi:transcriptional regulator with XRE-family HTH domain